MHEIFEQRMMFFSARILIRLIGPRGYKTFFMLNSAERETFPANKYENANNSWHFHIN